MVDKYYTPDISEFHVGFEFEELIGTESNGLQNWSEKKFNPVDFIDSFGEYYFPNLFSDCVRVKYLDKEDIESLGFKFDCNITRKSSRFFYNEIGLLFNNENKRVRIWSVETTKQIFDGKIKNISELKQVLTMLGINYG